MLFDEMNLIFVVEEEEEGGRATENSSDLIPIVSNSLSWPVGVDQSWMQNLGKRVAHQLD